MYSVYPLIRQGESFREINVRKGMQNVSIGSEKKRSELTVLLIGKNARCRSKGIMQG